MKKIKYAAVNWALMILAPIWFPPAMLAVLWFEWITGEANRAARRGEVLFWKV